MEARPSADILPFPGHFRGRVAELAPIGGPAPEDPQVRLQRALAVLEAALSAQREAVAQWRGSIGALHGSVQSLGTSLHDYHARLGALGAQVSDVNSTARQMAAWADDALGIVSADDALGIVSADDVVTLPGGLPGDQSLKKPFNSAVDSASST